MIFSSIFFLYVFLPIVLILYYIVPFKIGPVYLKNLVLLLVSLVFYAWGEPIYVILMIFSICINYVLGLEIEEFRMKGQDAEAKVIMIITVVINLGILGFYKYAGFVASNIGALLHKEFAIKGLALPIGISFYTFQVLSYVIDVYRGNVEAQRSLISFGAYVTMFPQLIAGPIVRYADIEVQLQNRKINYRKFGEGVIWFLNGLGKKVLIANNIGAMFDAIQAGGVADMPIATAWIGAFCYTMQIYFDFSGYSDMAIGLGKMLGFEFLKNFDYPYISKNCTEFWRRWHMSLGSWFREYVYIPLGGNRVSAVRHILNLLIVWGLTGLWHGAAWNFIAWGLYYGIILIIEKFVFKNFWDRIPALVQHIYTLILVMIGWMLFAANSMGEAAAYIAAMFGGGHAGFANATTMYYLSTGWLLGIIAALVSTPVVSTFFKKLLYDPRSKWKRWVYVAGYIGILFISTAYLVNSTYNPFLYFRF